MKRVKIKYVVLFVLLTGLSVTAGTGWYVLSRGFSARIPPTSAEAFVARHVRLLATPRAAKEARNPVAFSSDVLSEAMVHFADHCAICHDNDGSGDTDIGQGLYPNSPDLRQSETQRLTDGEIAYIIHNGIRFTGMPAFGEATAAQPDDDSWALVHFIRHLPEITAEELQAMEDMNPKSRMELEAEDAIRRFLAGDDPPPAEQEEDAH